MGRTDDELDGIPPGGRARSAPRRVLSPVPPQAPPQVPPSSSAPMAHGATCARRTRKPGS